MRSLDMRALAILLLLCIPVWGQTWLRSRLTVKPGEGLGPIKLGLALDDEQKKFLGPVGKQQAAGDGPGWAVYGSGSGRDLKKGILLRFNDLKQPDMVSSVEVRGVRAATDKGLFLGAPASLVRKKYPEAQLDQNPFSHQPEYVIPGLTMRVEKDKVREFLVEPAELTKWRFADLRVVAGQSAGPIQLGKPMSDEVFQMLGPPTTQVNPTSIPNSGLARWATGGQPPARMIEVTMSDGKRPKVVTSIRLRGVQAMTTQELKLGDRASALKEIYPSGREGLHANVGAETWRIPGLTFMVQGGRVQEIHVYKPR